MSVTLDWMRESDIDAVLAIERVAFRHPWTRAFFALGLNDANAFMIVARDQGRLVGYAAVWHIAEEMHLANIAVAPDRRHQGIGNQLLDFIISLGRELGCLSIYLEVRVSNTVARKFYARHGFVHAYTRKGYYHNNEDALVLVKDLALSSAREVEKPPPDTQP